MDTFLLGKDHKVTIPSNASTQNNSKENVAIVVDKLNDVIESISRMKLLCRRGSDPRK